MVIGLCTPKGDKHKNMLNTTLEYLSTFDVEVRNFGVGVSEDTLIDSLDDLDLLIIFSGMDRTNSKAADLISDIRLYRDFPIAYCGQFVNRGVARLVGADLYFSSLEDLKNYIGGSNKCMI